MKKYKKILPTIVHIFIISFFLVSFVPASVFGQEGGGKTTTKDDGGGKTTTSQEIKIDIKNPFKEDSIEGLIKTIIDDILLPIGSVVAVVSIIFAGFLYVTAGGDPAQVKKAHEVLKWAIVGSAILLGARVISEAVQGTINQLKK